MTCACIKQPSLEKLAMLLKRAADNADIPLTMDQAKSLRRELVKSLPDILNMIASASEGKAS